MSRVTTVARKQSWADLSDEDQHFGFEQSQSSNSKSCATDGASVTTGTGSPQMSWADISDDGSLSDLDTKCSPEDQDSGYRRHASARHATVEPVTSGAKAGRTSGQRDRQQQQHQQQSGHAQQWHGNGRSQKKNTRTPRMPASPSSPQQQRHQTTLARRQQTQQQNVSQTRPLTGGTDTTTWAGTPPSSQNGTAQPYSVKVQGMPAQLCNECCLDAILHQAGLQDNILSYDISEGVAVINLSSWHAATQCYNHFSTQSWNLGKSVQVKMTPIAQAEQHGNSEGAAAVAQEHKQQQQQQCEQQQQQQSPPLSPMVQAQHCAPVDCAMFFNQASAPNAACQTPTIVAWVPAPYVGEVCDYSAGAYFISQSPHHMAMAGGQMLVHA